MFDESKLLYLTEDEAMWIEQWISDNGFSLDSGHFELQFEFSPLGDSVVASWHQGDKVYSLDVYVDMMQRQCLTTTVGDLNINGFSVQLKMLDEQLKEYFRLARECTEAHLEVDCEPPGFGLTLRVQNGACSLFAGTEFIGFK